MKTVFVFGSNLAGRHGKGSAQEAYKHHGAVYGQGTGLQGNSYAIPTKDRNLQIMPLRDVEPYVSEFVEFAREHPEMTFDIVAIGCGLAGYKPEQVAPMFSNVPENCNLPPEFADILDLEPSRKVNLMDNDPLAKFRTQPRPAYTEPAPDKEGFDLGLYTALNDLVFKGDLEQASEVLAREAGEEKPERSPIDQRLLDSLAELKGAEEDHERYVAIRDRLFTAQTKARGVLEEALTLQEAPKHQVTPSQPTREVDIEPEM